MRILFLYVLVIFEFFSADVVWLGIGRTIGWIEQQQVEGKCLYIFEESNILTEIVFVPTTCWGFSEDKNACELYFV